MIWLLFACVVRYGETDSPRASQVVVAETIEFTQLAIELDRLIDSSESNDQKDRLNAAQDLLRQAKGMQPQAQKSIHRYLTYLLEIENRNQMIQIQTDDEQNLTSMMDISDEITEEELTFASEEDQILQAAENYIQQRQLKPALKELEKCRYKRCWTVAKPIWEKARDEFVALEVKNANTELIRARLVNPLQARLRLSKQVERSLKDLLQTYPESSSLPIIKQLLISVRQEISQVEESIQRSLRGDSVSD